MAYKETKIQSESRDAIVWADCLEMANGSADTAQELLVAFIDELPALFQDIEKAHDNKDCEALYKAVHKLHGGCCYSGTPALKAICHLLEVTLKENNPRLFEQHYSKLTAEVDRVLATFADGDFR